MYVDPYDRVRKRPTIYDGRGHTTRPYDTIKGTRKATPYHVNRRWLRFHARFYTQNGGYDAYYTIGRYDTKDRTSNDNPNNQLTTPRLEHEFSNELMGFKTSNQGNNSISTMNIYLFGFRDWEQILQVNDYCALTVDECYPDDKEWLEQTKHDQYAEHGIERRTLMTGLIANIHVSEDSQSQGRIYTITCNGMEKILADITLGLPPKAQIGGVNLLFDINGESNPANETFPFGNNTGSTKTTKKSSGGGAYGLTGVPGQIAKWFSSQKHMDKAQIAGILGTVERESNFKLHAVNSSSGATGLFQIIGSSYTKGNKNSSSVASQCEAISSFGGRVDKYKRDTSSYSSPVKCSETWGADVEIGGVNGEGNQTCQEWYKRMH